MADVLCCRSEKKSDTERRLFDRADFTFQTTRSHFGSGTSCSWPWLSKTDHSWRRFGWKILLRDRFLAAWITGMSCSFKVPWFKVGFMAPRSLCLVTTHVVLASFVSLCTFLLWNGMTHVPVSEAFEKKKVVFCNTHWTMSFCSRRVFCWANHFVRGPVSCSMTSDNHFITLLRLHFRQCKKGDWNLDHA